MNILLKNVLDACMGAIAFYLLGYGFAYGGSESGGFIGDGDFALSNTAPDNGGGWASFFFQWAFSAAAATIVSGSVAERTSFIGYLCYSAFLTGFVYPVVVHWCAAAACTAPLTTTPHPSTLPGCGRATAG